MKEINENTTIKDFMEWYVIEYEDCGVLPGDFEKVLDRMEGYSLAKSNTPEGYVLSSAVTKLRTAKNFFEVIKRYSNWKYTR